MTTLLYDDSHIYCLWFVPFEDGDNFFAAMINDRDGNRVIYRFESASEKRYYTILCGNKSIKDFRRIFNATVEEFCMEANSRMEFLPVDGNIHRALDIIEKQPWADDILP